METFDQRAALLQVAEMVKDAKDETHNLWLKYAGLKIGIRLSETRRSLHWLEMNLRHDAEQLSGDPFEGALGRSGQCK
jgi:hypothetical protein